MIILQQTITLHGITLYWTVNEQASNRMVSFICIRQQPFCNTLPWVPSRREGCGVAVSLYYTVLYGDCIVTGVLYWKWVSISLIRLIALHCITLSVLYSDWLHCTVSHCLYCIVIAVYLVWCTILEMSKHQFDTIYCTALYHSELYCDCLVTGVLYWKWVRISLIWFTALHCITLYCSVIAS